MTTVVEPVESVGSASRLAVGADAQLPQPHHLLASASGTRHLHFGLFATGAEPLPGAMESTALVAARRIGPGTRVLDLGCGLGGTTMALLRRGLDAWGIDPSPALIEAARRHPAAAGTPLGQRIATGTLFDGALRGRFGALVQIEVLQFFPDLRALVRGWAECLAGDSASVVIVDVFAAVARDWRRVPFHPVDRLRAAARPFFELVEQVDLTKSALPTMPRLNSVLSANRAAFCSAFAPRNGVAEDIAELQSQLTNLHCALRNGDLSYRLIVLRKR